MLCRSGHFVTGRNQHRKQALTNCSSRSCQKDFHHSLLYSLQFESTAARAADPLFLIPSSSMNGRLKACVESSDTWYFRPRKSADTPWKREVTRVRLNFLIAFRESRDIWWELHRRCGERAS